MKCHQTRSLRRLSMAALSLLWITGFAVSASAEIVSLNIANDTAGVFDGEIIVDPETFGVGLVEGVNSDVGNWVNTKASSKSNLNDKDGNPTTVDYSGTQPNGQGSFNAAYIDTPCKAGLDVYSAGANTLTLTVSDLNATFPTGMYAVVYLTGFNGNNGASISDGTTTYYYQNIASPSAPVTFVQTTQTTYPGDNLSPEAQYAVFGSAGSELTADSYTFTLTALAGGAALGGIQLVGANGNVVSLNFAQNPPNPQTITGTETFGVGLIDGVDTTVGNWANTGGTTVANVKNSSGVATTVNFTGDQPGGRAAFDDAYDDTASRAGYVTFSAATTFPTASFDNLNANFPNGYFAIVYMGGFTGNTGASIGDGTTTYYFQTKTSPVAPVTFAQTTQTSDLGDGLNPEAEYAVFGSVASPLTDDTITFTLQTLYGGGSALAGVQLVGVPAAPVDPVITNSVINGSGDFVIDFTGTPSTDYEVKKSTVLSGFSSLTVPLTVTTDAGGIGQATVPASELAGAKQFFLVEDAP